MVVEFNRKKSMTVEDKFLAGLNKQAGVSPACLLYISFPRQRAWAGCVAHKARSSRIIAESGWIRSKNTSSQCSDAL